MKHESRTINQSRTWAAVLCAGLEKCYMPSNEQIAFYEVWYRAERECRSKGWFYCMRRYHRPYATIVQLRDHALRDLLTPPPP